MKIPLKIQPADLIHHKRDIQIQAIQFYRGKETVFAGEPRRERWKSCVRLVADCWMHLGPQSFGDGTVIHLP